jgi:TP901 family phage tail tape measure protein
MATDVKYFISLQDKFSGKMNTINKATQSFDKSLGRTIGRFASFAAVGAVLTDSVKKIAEFEQQVSNLSAITGLVGEDLDFLSKKAIELGGATTKSSIDTVKAFKLIASAKPELLDDAQALAQVTKEAIALSEASGLDLPTAATALTDSLNQFSLSADQSSRVINVLAAGSKFAAAEIPDLTMSLKEFGGVAESMGISVEESAAAVETLSSKGLKGQRAGIQLRNVLLKLGASADKKINPKVVGLSKALENLADIQDDTTKLTKMFGRQNVLAAQTLIKNKNRVDELTDSLTGTSIAYEQQSVNTNNLISDYQGLESSWEKLVLNLNQGSGAITKSLRTATQFATEFLDKIDEINKSDEERAGRVASTQKELFDPYLKQAKTEEEFNKTILAERQRVANEIQIATEKFQEFGGREAVERAKKMNSVGWGLTRSIGESVGLVDTQKNLEIELNAERLSGLREYSKQLGELKRKGFTEAMEEITEPEIVTDGLDKVEDQVTKITSAAPKTFNVNINNLVEEFNINSQTVQEGAVAARETIIEALTRAVADVQARA